MAGRKILGEQEGRRGTRRSRPLPKLVALVPVEAAVASARYSLHIGG